MKWNALRAAFPHTLPVLAGYAALGMAYGVLMQSLGFSLWVPLCLSALVYAGSMQYALAPLLCGVFDPIGVFLLTLMVNARHVFYGISLLAPYRATGKKASYLIFSMTDETFSIQVSAKPPKGVDEAWFRFFISLLNHFYWFTATLLGALLGSVLPFDSTGIEFAMTALFVTIFVGQWQQTTEHRPALLGLAASAVCLFLFGPQSFILPAMACITLGLLALRTRLEGEKEPCK